MRFEIKSKELKNVLDAANGYRDECILDLRSQGILLRIQDESNSALYSSFIPDDIMDDYDRGEHPRIGIYTEKMYNVLPSTDDVITVELTDRGKIEVVANRKYTLPPIDPDTVSGVPDKVPDLSLPVQVVSEPDWLMEFISESRSYIHDGKKGGSFFLSANEGIVMLWSKKDDWELEDTLHWEDFNNYDIDWSKATQDSKGSMPINPQEERRIECLLSLDLTKHMKFYSDKVEFSWGNGMPLKAVSESEEGIKHSWIVPPRFPTDSEHNKIPDDVLKKRAVV